MKKIIAILAILTTVASVQADLVSRTWTSAQRDVNISGNPAFLTAAEAQGDGASWAYEIWNISDGVLFKGSVDPITYGWRDGLGYYLAAFEFDAVEEKEVALRFYNNINEADATYFIQSQSMTLADIETATPPIDAFDVTFNFAGQQWQAVPEPATFSLIGLVGLGMIVARRRALRKASNL